MLTEVLNTFFLFSAAFLLTVLDKNFKGFNNTNVSPVFHYEGNVRWEKSQWNYYS